MRGGYALTLVLFLVHSSLQAEIIYLKTGERFVGTISGQDSDHITIVTEKRRIRTKKSNVARISFNTTDEQEEIIKVEGKVQDMREWQRQLDRVLAMRRKEQGLKAKQQETRQEEEKGFFQDELLEIKKIKQKEAAQKSTLAPGWGQFAKGHDIRGWLIMGGHVLAAAGAYYSLKTYTKYSDRYNQGNMNYYYIYYWRHNLALSYWQYSASVQQRRTMENSIAQADILLAAILLFYGLNIADAYWSDPSTDVLMGASLSQKEEGVDEGRWISRTVGREAPMPGTPVATAPELFRLGYSFNF